MGKTGKWLRHFLTGKRDKDHKDKDKSSANHTRNPSSIPTEKPTTPISFLPTTPKEKRRWSFRRSSASQATPSKDLNSSELVAAGTATPALVANLDSENEQKKHAMAVAAATAEAAEAAAAAAQAAAAVIRLTAAAKGRGSAIEEVAAIKIQSVFRSYLARKALRALRGLVKLQALVRGHLVRKRATATLRCIQALVTVQARALENRLRSAEGSKPTNPRLSAHRKSTQDSQYRDTYHESEKVMEENIKIVEMDLGESKASTLSRSSYSTHPQPEWIDPEFPGPPRAVYSKPENNQISLAPSELSPRTCSGHFEDYSLRTGQSSPHFYSAVSKPDPTRIPFAFPRPEYPESLSYDYPLYPNYMANTESSRAKARSQSAPKQRPDNYYERQPSRRRPSVEGRNVPPRAMRMQRSSSHVGSAVQNYQYPWSIKLDKSTVSLKQSECGSTSTVLTDGNYCRSLVSYDVHGNRY